ncbi:putative 60S ribosomal protein L34-A [Hypsibius exemplaris]|uniref:Large ribosomal subunit protein eL34 n=1 Tax=Hypsibius exemplaris TaxID=2072580 RepID=A0A1W0WER6_HYPEX|nr:putative 60S ribosomal protein L34-A [Hypsibius exemplaris]
MMKVILMVVNLHPAACHSIEPLFNCVHFPGLRAELSERPCDVFCEEIFARRFSEFPSRSGEKSPIFFILQLIFVRFFAPEEFGDLSNKHKIVKTPGGRLTYIYLKKLATPARCGDCKRDLPGVIRARPRKLHSVSKRQKHVTRTYGGSRCHFCVRTRIIRAFLIEEQKIVQRVLKAKEGTVKRA